MLIYRIQKNGVGPYKNNLNSLRYPWELEYFDSYLPDGTERNQQPDTDIGTDLEKFVINKNFKLDGYIFGFANKKDLFTWFSPVHLGYLYANGFSIWSYDVPEEFVVKGTRQLCFQKDKSIWSKKLDVKSFRKL